MRLPRDAVDEPRHKTAVQDLLSRLTASRQIVILGAIAVAVMGAAVV